MKKFPLLILFAFPVLLLNAQKQVLPVIKSPVFKKDTISILKYGAKPDGYTLNTKSITDAIEAMNKKGGGVVLVPAGLWLTGPLVLKK